MPDCAGRANGAWNARHGTNSRVFSVRGLEELSEVLFGENVDLAANFKSAGQNLLFILEYGCVSLTVYI